ncbi:probable protein phosphatase 2C 32 [Phragmites australis]|uniref:probable protein phosphatase 2C 32 n=1 Tax=Phragmites australis TaxID=29695 RepID=UPI002D764B80|nr:probable protein phosphatase 2C 32 [Phragmites australis]
MSCTVAIPSSPVFSPSRRSLSCKAASASPDPVPASVSSPAPAPAAASPLRPFALRALLREEASPSSPQRASAPVGSVLKRRRPALLVVPVSGAAAAVAAVEADPRNEVEEEGEEFAAYCRRGKGRRRVEMEDRYVAKVALGGDPQVALFGVFDGHGGKNAAEFAAENLPKFMAEEMKKVDGGEIEGAVKRGYLRTDEEFLRRQESGGACCVTAVLKKGDLVVSNVGDCRAVVSRAGKAEALTSDHRASREDEKERIEKLGGFVVNCRGTWRVQGSLAVSRGIGDAHLKQWVVSDPDSRSLLVDQQCEFLILASDGLWDKIGNQEAVDLARPLCGSNDKDSRMAACRMLAETSISRGSTDDISVLIIQLQKFSSS